MPVLEVKNLAIGYNGHRILQNLDFTVKEGDYLCIVGENGAGKSTLMKTILGLKEPLNGNVSFGTELRKHGIGYLPQQNEIQKDFPASVWEVVLSGNLSRIGMRPFYNKEDKKRAEENMKKLDILDLKKRCYRNLSGGQQQRVLLARALCATDSLILLDEPVAGLDPKVTQDMYHIIEDLNKEGITIIMITHDIPAATKYASHILYIGKNTAMYRKEAFLDSQIAKMFHLGEAENV